MLHDFLLALLGIEGDLIQLDAKSKSAFQLTALARRHLHAAEVSLIETSLLQVASAAASLRRFSDSVPSSPFKAGLREVVSDEIRDFANFVQQLERDLLRVPSLSVAFLVRKLQPWQTRFAQGLDILRRLELDENKAVDQLLKSQVGSARPEIDPSIIAKFTKACILVLSRAAIALCVYGEVVCDVTLSEFPLTFPLEIREAADFCFTGLGFLKDDDLFQVELSQLWTHTASPITTIEAAILATKRRVSEKLKSEFLGVFLSDFTKIANLFLLQDGFFWQTLFDEGDVVKFFASHLPNAVGSSSSCARLSSLATGFSLAAEFGNSALLVLDRGCRLHRGPALEFASDGGRAAVHGREFALGRFPGFRVTLVLNRLGMGGRVQAAVHGGSDDGPRTLVVREESGEYLVEVEGSGAAWKSVKLPVLVQWVSDQDGQSRLIIDGQIVEVRGQAGLCTSNAVISLSGADVVLGDWKFEAVGVQTALDRFPVFDKLAKLYSIELDLASVTQYLVPNESLLVYNSIFRFLYSFKKLHHEVSRIPLSQHNLYVYSAKKALYDVCAFLFRDVVANDIAAFLREVAQGDFLEIREVQSQFIARLVTRLFMRHPAVLTALGALVDGLRRDCLKPKTGEALAVALRDLQGAKRRLCTALREAGEAGGYAHAVMLEAVLSDE